MKPDIREMPSSELQSSFPSTFGYQPWVIQLDASNKHGQIFINPFSGTTSIKKIKPLEKKICLGSYQEWLLLINVSTNEPFLFSHISGTEIRLPVMSEPLESLGGFVLSSEPTSPKCIVVLACKNQKFILHCRPNGPEWIKVTFPTLHTRIVGQIVICKEKLYILVQKNGYNQLLTINMESLRTGITEFTIIKGPVKNYPASEVHNDSDHLLVSGDNILLVSFNLPFRAVARVEAHFLETSNISWKLEYQHDTDWKRVEISDHGNFFFSTDCNMSFVPNHVDIQCNYVYLLRSEQHCEKLYKISLDDKIVRSIILPKTVSTEWNRFCWVVPSRSHKRKEKSASCQNDCSSEKGKGKIAKKDNTITSNISRSWADLPIELVQLLLPHLGLVDCIRFRSVCKAWSSLSHPVLEAKLWPLLMYFPDDCSSCWLFDPIYNQEYNLDMEWFTSGEKCTLHFSKDSWVLLSIENRTYVVNPFTRETVELPCCEFTDPCSFAFCSLPTSEDFMVFGTCGAHDGHPTNLYFWWPGEEKGKIVTSWDKLFSLHMGWSNPLFFDGKLYCLGRRGNLRKIDPCSTLAQWICFETPTEEIEDCYLLELDGDLIFLFRERTKRKVGIFMLEHPELDSNKREDIGDMTLFLGQRSVIAKKIMLGKHYANCIYFPGFVIEGDRKLGAYYYVDSGSCHPKFENLHEPMNWVWIQPSLSVNNPTNHYR